jgi:hypothetical protein
VEAVPPQPLSGYTRIQKKGGVATQKKKIKKLFFLGFLVASWLFFCNISLIFYVDYLAVMWYNN